MQEDTASGGHLPDQILLPLTVFLGSIALAALCLCCWKRQGMKKKQKADEMGMVKVVPLNEHNRNEDAVVVLASFGQTDSLKNRV